MRSDIENKILAILIDRVPNYVSEISIVSRLSKHPKELVKRNLKSLIDQEIIELNEDPHLATGTPDTFYRMKNIQNLPIRKTIKIGDIELPRLLSDSKPSLLPEILNEQAEGIAEYSTKLEEHFKNQMEKEVRRYLAILVGILGTIISILALIIVGLPKIQTDPTLPFWDVVFFNLAQLLPLVIVLGLLVLILVLILRWVIR